MLTHYSNATISKPIPYQSGWGYATGQAQDRNTGKAMFFQLPEKSPGMGISWVMFDIETFNFSLSDSFNVNIWRDTADINGNWSPGRPGSVIATEKFGLSEIDSISTGLGKNGPAAFNLAWNSDISSFGLGWHVWIGITYESNDSALLALRATGNGEFIDSNRVITLDSLRQPVTIKSTYNLDVALAIFPAYDHWVGLNEKREDNIIPFTCYIENGQLVVLSNFGNTEQYEITLRDLNGRLITEKTILNSSESSIEISQIPNGIYVLNVSSNTFWHSKKLFIRN